MNPIFQTDKVHVGFPPINANGKYFGAMMVGAGLRNNCFLFRELEKILLEGASQEPTTPIITMHVQ